MRAKKPSLLLCLIVLGIGCDPVGAYDLNTHEALSIRAANASRLGTDPELLKALGSNASSVFPNSVDPSAPRTIVELIGDGSRFEDTLSLARARHHFFDPIRNRALTVLGVAVGERSPDWALEDKDEISAQQFSLKDARGYLFEALTRPTEEERSRAFGLIFQTLGHVIHHIQDMAAPQHVRNDLHLDVPNVENLPGESPSLYETYTNTRVGSAVFAELLQRPYPRGVAFATARKFWVTQEQPSPGRGTGEGIAEFTNNNFVSAGTNFELQGNKIVSNSTYFLPVPESISEVAPIESLLSEAERCQPNRQGTITCLTGRMIFVKTTVHDKYLNATLPNSRASTLSIFTADLKKYNVRVVYEPNEMFPETRVVDEIFTLNRFNFDVAHQFLIPRAVAYSAGLIDYFFRGRLEAHDVSFAERNGRVEVSLKVRNAIDAEKIPAWAGEGLESRQGAPSEFVLTVNYQQGEEERLIASDPVGFRDPQPIKPGETSKEVYTFDLPVLPEDASEIEYRLVFRGRLGQEDDAIAVGLVEQVSGFLVQPSYLPDDGLGGRRLITEAAGTWRLSPEQGLQAANIDWKGAYVNGRPTKVLTWFGPKARYFPNPIGNPFGNIIFQSGERFAVAPCSVLGAAVARDAQDKEWLVIICNKGVSDAVFRRPNTKSDSLASFDPVNNPEGWQEIAVFPWQSNWQPPNRPWFFNGDGSEAQTMRQFQNANKLDRLLIRIEPDGPSAQLTNLGNLEGIADSTTVNHMVQGAASPGLCDRDKSASGHEHRETRLTRTLSGGYVMVVDYDNKTEILGTIVASGTNEFVQILDQDWNCVGDRLEQESATVQITQIAGESTEFGFGTQGKAIPVRKQTGSASATLAKLSSDSTWLTGSGTVTITEFRLLLDLYYLDLRHGLYVAREGVNRNLSSTGAIADGQVCITRTGEGSSLQQISYTREILIDEQNTDPAASFCSSNMNLLPGVTPIFSNSGVEVTHVIFPTLPIRTVEGSWVVSSGEKLFASQEYRDKDSNLKVFNFLTDGDPKALIPTAPEEPRYFPVYVVK